MCHGGPCPTVTVSPCVVTAVGSPSPAGPEQQLLPSHAPFQGTGKGVSGGTWTPPTPAAGVSWTQGCGGLRVGAGCTSAEGGFVVRAQPGCWCCGVLRAPTQQWDLPPPSWRVPSDVASPGVGAPRLAPSQGCWWSAALWCVTPGGSWCSGVTRVLCVWRLPCPAPPASPGVVHPRHLLFGHPCSSRHPQVQVLGHPEIAAPPDACAFALLGLAASLSPDDLPSPGLAAPHACSIPGPGDLPSPGHARVLVICLPTPGLAAYPIPVIYLPSLELTASPDPGDIFTIPKARSTPGSWC